MERTPLISLKDVSVFYGTTEAVCSANLDIFQDDFIGIIGPNGGGKTTLVKAILGLVPHTGRISYSPTLSQSGINGIGYLPQISTFDRSFPLSAGDVVLSGLQAKNGFTRRYSKTDIDKAKHLLQLSNLAELYDRQIGELSGGQIQRVMLCRSIIMDPKLLILDEPTNFVDNSFENELYHMLSDLSQRMAIVMVSHDIGTITSVVKSIVCVNKCVHRHDSNIITQEQLDNYGCPIQVVSHGDVPHTVLGHHGACPHCHD